MCMCVCIMLDNRYHNMREEEEEKKNCFFFFKVKDDQHLVKYLVVMV